MIFTNEDLLVRFSAELRAFVNSGLKDQSCLVEFHQFEELVDETDGEAIRSRLIRTFGPDVMTIAGL